MEQNPIQKARDDIEKAMENYSDLERERDDLTREINDLRVDNAALVGEVNMLREEMARCDKDRVRLQAVSNTLLGRLFSINDVIGGAVRAAIKDGIEAVDPPKSDEAIEKAAGEVHSILQRVQPHPGTEATAAPKASPAPPQAVGAAIPPEVDWAKLPQG